MSMTSCQDCGEPISAYATSCACGWKAKAPKVINNLTLGSLLKSQAEYYGRKLSDEAIAIYEKDLREFRFQEVEQALDGLRNNGATRMPLATDIRQKIRESQPRAPSAEAVNEREVEICNVMTEMWFSHKQGVELEKVFECYASSMQFYGITRERCAKYFASRENILKVTGRLIPWTNFRYASDGKLEASVQDEKFKMLTDFFSKPP